MIDHQSQNSYATKSIDAITLHNDTALVAKAATEFDVSTILTTVAEKAYAGPMFDEIRSTFPKQDVTGRTNMNTTPGRLSAIFSNRGARTRAEDCVRPSLSRRRTPTPFSNKNAAVQQEAAQPPLSCLR